MKENKIKEELQLYSNQYCVNPLSNVGFTNYRDDLLNWYKIYNGIICHFHLVSYTSQIPTLMMVWRIHPTYVPATLNVPAVWLKFKESGFWSFFASQVHLAPNSFVIGGGMNLPDQPQIATDRLVNEFFPQMERLQTREELYIFRRKEILSKATDPRISLANLTKPDFADEALIMKDSELFPACIECIEVEISRSSNKHIQSSFSRSPELLKAQLGALHGVNVEQYLEMMKERKNKFLKSYNLQDNVFEL